MTTRDLAVVGAILAVPLMLAGVMAGIWLHDPLYPLFGLACGIVLGTTIMLSHDD